ncbi:MAG TPA: hypothetical protein DDZ51_27940 [Planctomycetaceae bacterium]|nr:hypothetical protein [Planctomycetaceae bacterium]
MSHDSVLTDRSSLHKRKLWIAICGTAFIAIFAGIPFWRLQSSDLRKAENSLRQAERLASEGRERDAIAAINEVANPADFDAEKLIDLASAAEQQDMKSLATRLLRAANHRGPMQEEALRKLISLQWELEDFSSVLSACEELSKLAPTDTMPWLVSAGIYHENEKVAEALNAYHQALRLNPPKTEIARVRYQIAELSLFTGDLKTARQMVDPILVTDPDSLDFALIHARLLRQEGKPQEQLAVVNRILMKQPNHNLALMMRGENYLDSGFYQKALDDFAKVVQSNPFDYQAHYKLALAYQRAGDKPKAEDHFAKSNHLTEIISKTQVLLFQVQQDPNNRRLRLELAKLSEMQGDQETAEYWKASAKNLPD